MRKLSVQTFVTLDGVMQAPGGPEEDPTGGFEHGGWSAPYWNDMMGRVMGESMARPSELLLGRKTYEVFAAHWPYATDEPGAAELNSAKKYVVSTTLTKAGWNNSTIISGDVPQEIAKLKEADGHELRILGSSELIQTLLRHDLIDEFGVWISPVVIGKGKRLFGDGTIPAGLKLLDSKTSTTGVVILTYGRGDALPTGSFALEESTDAEVARREKMAEER
ncbi:MAG: dihydrofolate reductase family protein [Dehalococcoidia bacterium]